MTYKKGHIVSVETRNKIREANSKEKAYNWKGGHSYGYQKKIYRPLAKTLEQKCIVCSSRNKLVTHHIDKNHENNKITNLTIMCNSCHQKHHHPKKYATEKERKKAEYLRNRDKYIERAKRNYKKKVKK